MAVSQLTECLIGSPLCLCPIVDERAYPQHNETSETRNMSISSHFACLCFLPSKNMIYGQTMEHDTRYGRYKLSMGFS